MLRWNQQSGRSRLLMLLALSAASMLLAFAGQLRSAARQPRNGSLRSGESFDSHPSFFSHPSFSRASSAHASQEPGAQELPRRPLRGQTSEEASLKSTGCVSCHIHTDEPTMHPTGTVFLGCTDCHGGDPSVSVTAGTTQNTAEYQSAKEKAHVKARQAIFKDRSAVPPRT